MIEIFQNPVTAQVISADTRLYIPVSIVIQLHHSVCIDARRGDFCFSEKAFIKKSISGLLGGAYHETVQVATYV